MSFIQTIFLGHSYSSSDSGDRKTGQMSLWSLSVSYSRALSLYHAKEIRRNSVSKENQRLIMYKDYCPFTHRKIMKEFQV
jgi:fructose-bisphosphate aldolase class 1